MAMSSGRLPSLIIATRAFTACTRTRDATRTASFVSITTASLSPTVATRRLSTRIWESLVSNETKSSKAHCWNHTCFPHSKAPIKLPSRPNFHPEAPSPQALKTFQKRLVIRWTNSQAWTSRRNCILSARNEGPAMHGNFFLWTKLTEDASLNRL